MSAGFLLNDFLFSAEASATPFTQIQGTFPTGIYAGETMWGGAVTRTQPVTEPASPKTGYIEKGYGFNDLYDRIHVLPTDINIGNLLSVQLRDVEVWNAYTESVSLLDIAETNADGVTLLQPFALPVQFNPLQSFLYQIKVDTVGPPVIDGGYSFLFDTEELIFVSVVGKRVVVWPFVPQHDFTESLEWKTSLIKAKLAEQRQALRKLPRQGFEYTYWMTEQQYSMAKAIAYGWSNRIFGVPVWNDVTLLGGVPAETTALDFDTTSSDYREDDVVLLWQGHDMFEACEVESISPNGLVLKLPTVNPYSAAYVVPVRYGRLLDGFNAKRDANKRVIADMSFEITQNADLAASISLPQYKSLDVVTDPMMKVSDFSEKIMREVTVIDNGIGVPYQDATYGYTNQSSTISWSMQTRAALWRVRQWLHSRKGRWKAFWLPTRLQDMTVVVDMTASATTLIVQNMGYTLYYGARNVCILTRSGTYYYNTITSGTVNEDGTETLFLESAIGGDIPVSQIEFVCFMNKMRLDSDRVEISHESGLVTISIPVTEVPA